MFESTGARSLRSGRAKSRPHALALALVLALPALAAGPKKPMIDFESQSIEGEVQRPSLQYVPGRPSPTFRCDATKLTAEQYNACFEQHLAEMCGVQVIERERYELKRIGSATSQTVRVRTVGSNYPFAFHVDEGSLYVQEASEYEDWRERSLVLKDQSPGLATFDSFAETPQKVIFGDRRTRRVFTIAKDDLGYGPKPFRKVELFGGKQELLGVLATEQFVVSTSKEVLLMGLDKKTAARLAVPLADYWVDPHVSRAGQLLLVSKAPGGKVYLLAPNGAQVGAFDRDPRYWYYLMPNGLVASVDLNAGKIKIRNQTGVVLSQTGLGRPLTQFGVFRNQKEADLFFVAQDGVGILYGDGFEKSFLALKGGTVGRVVEAEDGVLGVVVSGPGREDPTRMLERRLDFFRLGQAGSKISRLVEGICPNSIRFAERALELRSSIKASVKDGSFQVYR